MSSTLRTPSPAAVASAAGILDADAERYRAAGLDTAAALVDDLARRLRLDTPTAPARATVASSHGRA